MRDWLKKIIRSEKGVSLVEVVIALGLLGLIATSFLMAIFVATKSIAIADERTTAESLARTQLESIKQQDYPDDPGSATQYARIDLSENPHYSIGSINESLVPDPDIWGIPWDNINNGPAPSDRGLQKITLIIYHDDSEVFTLEGFKVDEGIY
jgi:type II secretory pathway pseudopilin PulG